MTRVRTMLFAVLMVTLLSGFSGNLYAASADEEAISGFMNKDLAAAWKSNSPGKVLELFTESIPVAWLDATSKNPPVTSKDGRKKELDTLFDKVQVVDFVMTDLVVTKISDTLALVTCTETITIMDKATKMQDQLVGRTLYEVIKEKDKWHAYREISFAADAVN